MIGTPKILIPIKPEELTIEKLLPYFPTILSTFESQASVIKERYEKYCLKHDVLNKKRPHDDTDINNKVLEPHIHSLVEWKTGYIVGNPMKYAQSKDINTDDIEYLNRYVRASNKQSVDIEVLTSVYATGVGYYFIEPKDISEGEIDLEKEAPFDLFYMPANTCCKVYSSYKGNKPLFDFLYTKIEEQIEGDTPKTFTIVSVYLPNKFYEFKLQDIKVAPKISDLVQDNDRSVYNYLPLVEKRLLNGIGIVETVSLLQDALDKISSNSVDNIEDTVNAIFKYKGIKLGDTAEEQAENHRAVRRNGAIAIPFDNASGHEPDLEIENTKELNFKDIEGLTSRFEKVMYSSVGVPIAVSNTNSGGTTKQGSEVANGYDNAYTRALGDISSYINADRELLNRILFICKIFPKNKVNELNSSDITIKYCLNLTDNMLIKSQSAGTLYNINMPKAMILEKCKMSNDPEAEGKIWEEYDKQQLENEDDKIDIKGGNPII